MATAIIQPTDIYLSVVIMGVFTGIGVAVGGAIVEVWLKPKLIKWKEKRLHEHIKDKINGISNTIDKILEEERK